LTTKISLLFLTNNANESNLTVCHLDTK